MAISLYTLEERPALGRLHKGRCCGKCSELVQECSAVVRHGEEILVLKI
jgi:hypothetical protein